ncbi:MAG: hypothetical protein A3J74_04110 [Elusimicrobia bacterium RIFCSPHIGHO2_02_FULL_57_9]|nr:MAG: hypothetical protein A3J74_04110 [Elusimicrobia bacterium RIFCSPHIGHO2_02_FULL_57_9]
MRSRVCVLVSGGVDSSVLLADKLRQGHEVYPLYVGAGFKWEKVELAWLRRLLKRLKTPRLKSLTVTRSPMQPLMKSHWAITGRRVPDAKSASRSVYIPGRNMVLIAQAGLFCALHDIPELALAILKCNPFPDARPGFLKSMEKTVSAATNSRIRISTPYAELSKDQVIKRVPGFAFQLTFSCLRPNGGKHCGNCNKCEERREAIDNLSYL